MLKVKDKNLKTRQYFCANIHISENAIYTRDNQDLIKFCDIVYI